MSVQLNVDYQQIVELVQQLSHDEQDNLIDQILARRFEERSLSVEEKLRLFDAAKIHTAVNETPSVRREDWYDDDGR